MSGAVIPAATSITVLPVTPLERLAAELFIASRARGIADQRLLTQALGLDSGPRATGAPATARRAVPDGFRRTRRPGRRHG